MAEYCPLCGAHESEQEEGEADDETILKWEKEIIMLNSKVYSLRKKKEASDATRD